MKQCLLLVCLLTWSAWTLAKDPSISLAGTTPISQFERAGGRLYVQNDFARQLTLGFGYAQSEPQLGISQGSLIARVSIPFQTSLNERIYPFVGLDQRVEAETVSPDWFFGAGVEQQWIDQWGGFIETRFQTGREVDWHLQVGIRFWPGRAKRLDVRMRNSEPDRVADDSDFNDEIELSDIEQRVAEVKQEVKQPEPEPEPEPEPATEPEPIVQPKQVLNNLMDQAKRDLPDGVYVHLGFFRQVHSIQRYRNLVTDFVWGDELLVHYDERLNGYRIMIGPYTEADARARRQAILDSGMDAFIYFVPERPRNR